MVETELVSQRSRSAILKRVTVRQAIGEIDQPGCEKERGATGWSQGRMKNSGEQPEPGDGDERRVETNQIEPGRRRNSRCHDFRFSPRRNSAQRVPGRAEARSS